MITYEEQESPETNTQTTKTKSNSFWQLLVTGLGVLSVFLLAISIVLFVINRQLASQTAPTASDYNPILVEPNQVNEFITYQNTEYGFAITYPKYLKIEPTIKDTSTCGNDTSDCLGERLPEYQVNFLYPDESKAFHVELHVVPVVERLVAPLSTDSTFADQTPTSRFQEPNILVYGTEQNNMTFIFVAPTTGKLDLEQIEEIASSFELVSQTTRPQCLWTDHFLRIETDAVEIDTTQLDQSSGFKYNRFSQACEPVELYHSEEPFIPFQSIEECQAVCLPLPETES